MKCPSCTGSVLGRETIETGLIANACKRCGGHWISSEQYWTWLERLEESLPDPTSVDVDLEVNDPADAKVCPNCARILLKYRVGRGMEFFVEHCGHCDGVWLDHNEWAALKARDLHVQMHRIFSTEWQAAIASERVRRNLAGLYAAKFGDETYQEVRRIKQWIDAHPERARILAYLNTTDPYDLRE